MSYAISFFTSVKELDHWYGVEVVNRRSRPVNFSNVGERLLKVGMNDILPQVQIAQSDITRIVHGQTGRIIFSSECHSCFDWLMPLLNQYRQQYPDVDLDLQQVLSLIRMSYYKMLI